MRWPRPVYRRSAAGGITYYAGVETSSSIVSGNGAGTSPVGALLAHMERGVTMIFCAIVPTIIRGGACSGSLSRRTTVMETKGMIIAEIASHFGRE